MRSKLQGLRGDKSSGLWEFDVRRSEDCMNNVIEPADGAPIWQNMSRQSRNAGSENLGFGRIVFGSSGGPKLASEVLVWLGLVLVLS